MKCSKPTPYIASLRSSGKSRGFEKVTSGVLNSTSLLLHLTLSLNVAYTLTLALTTTHPPTSGWLVEFKVTLDSEIVVSVTTKRLIFKRGMDRKSLVRWGRSHRTLG
jgi:hypothetical protein